MIYDNNINVRGHSTRSIGPSWALFNGASKSAILNLVDWKPESIFTCLYIVVMGMNIQEIRMQSLKRGHFWF